MPASPDDDPTADIVRQIKAVPGRDRPPPPIPGAERPLNKLRMDIHGPLPTPEPPGILDQLKKFFTPPAPGEDDRARARDVSSLTGPTRLAQASLPGQGIEGLYQQQPPQGGGQGGGEFAGHLDAIAKDYPALAPHLGNVVVQRGAGQAGRMMEFYPPWERDNPNPGRTTLELFPGASSDPKQQRELMAADLMHLLGSVDPRSRQPVDPAFRALKDEFTRSMTPEQQAINQRAYQSQFANAPNKPRFADWMDHSRTDAFIRGGLFPGVNPDWQRPGTFSPQQQQILQRMRQHLANPERAGGLESLRFLGKNPRAAAELQRSQMQRAQDIIEAGRREAQEPLHPSKAHYFRGRYNLPAETGLDIPQPANLPWGAGGKKRTIQVDPNDPYRR